MSICLIAIPLISALIGWLSLYIAWRGFFCYLHKHQDEWKYQLSQVAVEEFISLEEIVGNLGTIDVSDQLDGLLSTRVQAVLDRFKENTPMVGMFLNDTVSTKIKSMVVEEITKEWPALQQSMTKVVLDRFDLAALVSRKLQALQPEQIERAVRKTAGKRVQQMAWLGAGLGFGLGLVQAGIVWLCG